MKRIPCATYRLQFNRQFTFRQAAEILDYLQDLGVSDIYASPLFEAGPDSTHGYDTCCFGRINPNLGTTKDFDALTANLKKRGFGLLLDVVPNHMSATLSNTWWRDVLEQGRESKYATFFDIDWHPANPSLENKVLVPVLEDHYEKVLESGKLKLTFQGNKFFITYHERNFPVDSTTLPGGVNQAPDAVAREFNGTPGNAASFGKLDALIQRQHYRLAYWKSASKEINYRRFFDVTEMVALKMELPEVFRETHRLIFEWLDSGKVTGLRIDHPDGLWDPKEYLQRLQRKGHPLYVVVEKILCGAEQLPSDWPVDGTTGYDFLNRVNGLFVAGSNADTFDQIYREFAGDRKSFDETVYASRKQVLEKSFASELNALTHRLRTISSQAQDFTFESLRLGLAEMIAAFPVYRTYVAESSTAISQPDRTVVQKAVREARVRAGAAVDEAIFEFIEELLLLEAKAGSEEAAQQREREFVMKFQQLTGPAMAKGLEDTAFYQFNRLISLNEVGGEPGKFGTTITEFHEANGATLKRWPHTMLASATHDTKRGEDLRARLNVLSEMPSEWREAIARWSRWNAIHKTIVEGAAAPDANDEYLLYQTLVGAWPVDDGNPDGLKSFRARVAAFMLKAVREAKVHTNWTETNAVYEKALAKFVEGVLADARADKFLDDLRQFSGMVAFFGRFNSLAQTLLKLTSPGIPDLYQGSELWDLSLVDPDNRRAVDYVVRQRLLSDLKRKFEDPQTDWSRELQEMLSDDQSGATKLFLIWRVLNFRKRERALFDEGDYVPLSVLGEKREHVCAFLRSFKEKTMVVAVPRLIFGLMEGRQLAPLGREIWKDTMLVLPPAHVGGQFQNILTGEKIIAIERNGAGALELGETLKNFPVALLELS